MLATVPAVPKGRWRTVVAGAWACGAVVRRAGAVTGGAGRWVPGSAVVVSPHKAIVRDVMPQSQGCSVTRCEDIAPELLLRAYASRVRFRIFLRGSLQKAEVEGWRSRWLCERPEVGSWAGAPWGQAPVARRLRGPDRAPARSRGGERLRAAQRQTWRARYSSVLLATAATTSEV